MAFVPRKLDNKLWSEFSEVHKTFFDRIKSGYQHLNTKSKKLLKNEKTGPNRQNSVPPTKFSEDPEQLAIRISKPYGRNGTRWIKVGGQTEMEIEQASLLLASQKQYLD